MLSLAIIAYQGLFSRLSGNGTGKQWGLSWVPEFLFSLPFGFALAFALKGVVGFWAIPIGLAAVGWSYIFMQSGTWMFLHWTHDDTPNLNRGGTLKGIMDWLAARFGYKLGDEGYSWIAAGVKGFLIGLPVGGIPLALLWPLGYEIGSHTRGRVEKYGLDPHIFSEIFAGMGAGIAIVLFLLLV